MTIIFYKAMEAFKRDAERLEQEKLQKEKPDEKKTK
ncbi:hypothetical protein KIS4809_3084 [Bacillus sp. ZZV12-4809]|nr:hypothetical protein KIS4809_3084 [Bacillus sp. ZZV12-4809]